MGMFTESILESLQNTMTLTEMQLKKLQTENARLRTTIDKMDELFTHISGGSLDTHLKLSEAANDDIEDDIRALKSIHFWKHEAQEMSARMHKMVSAGYAFNSGHQICRNYDGTAYTKPIYALTKKGLEYLHKYYKEN